MNEMNTDPRENPKLKDLVQKAIWIVKTFGCRRWRMLTNVGAFPGKPYKKSWCNFDFEWNNIRIHTYERFVLTAAGEVDFPHAKDPSIIISLKRMRAVNIVGVFRFHWPYFQEIYVRDVSREYPRLKIPEGADLAELGSEIDELHNALQRLKTESGMTAEEIKALSKRTLKQMLKVYLSALPDLNNPHL